MRRHRIFVDQPLSENRTIELARDAAGYLQQVLRLKIGHHIRVFDGSGGEYDADIINVRKQAVSINVGKHFSDDVESPLNIHIGQGMTRGDRMDYAIQKAVELGAATVTPIHTERSVTKLQSERVARRVQHWQSVSIHAAEQCGRTRIPRIGSPSELAGWTKTVEADLRLCMNPTADTSLGDVAVAGHRIALLVGPEGGLTDDELRIATSAGFISTRFGPRILRAETATVVGLSAIQIAWGDLS